MPMLEMLAASFSFESQSGGGEAWDGGNLNRTNKNKNSNSEKDSPRESARPRVQPRPFILHCIQLNMCLLRCIFISVEDKIRVFMTTSPEPPCK